MSDRLSVQDLLTTTSEIRNDRGDIIGEAEIVPAPEPTPQEVLESRDRALAFLESIAPEDPNGAKIVEGSRVRRVKRSPRERAIRRDYFDVGSVVEVYSLEPLGSGGSEARVAWDDGRSSRVKTSGLIVVPAADYPAPKA